MNKMNKKGFTLIEMLVVIAIIAVLVSIIIPVVSNATDKAACATNAANLRSIKAEATMNYLLNGEVKAPSAASTLSKKCSLCDANEEAVFSTPDANGNFTVTFGGKTIADFAAKAGGTSADAQGPSAS